MSSQLGGGGFGAGGLGGGVDGCISFSALVCVSFGGSSLTAAGFGCYYSIIDYKVTGTRRKAI